MRRFAPVVVVCLLFITVVAHAQTCPPPNITLLSGTNPTCAGQPVTLDAGAGWVTYQWTNGATTRMITDAPAATTSYSVTTTDASGCSVTSQSYQVIVSGASPAPPTIRVD